jgi:amino acid transporter
MSGNPRDAGLVRTLGTWSLAANLLSIIVGAGIFVVPAALAACMGAYAPLAFLGGGIAIAAVAICFAEGGSRVPTSGGAYGYIESAFGPRTGYVAGTLLFLSDVLACGGIAAALADASVMELPSHLKAPAHAGVIVCSIGAIAFINMQGVTKGARLTNVVTVLKLLPLLILVLAGTWAIRGGNFAAPASLETHGLGRGLILALFTFTGMESSLSASGEVRDPSHTIPRALTIAIGTSIVLYIAIQIVAQGILGASLSHSTAPLVDAMSRISPSLRVLMLAGAAIAMLGWLSGDLLSSPRLLFAFGRDGLFPRALGRIHPRTHAPRMAVGCYAAIATVLALTGTFAELAVLAMLTSAALYIGACSAAWRLARRGVAQAGTPLNFPWLGTAAVVGIASMTAIIALASRAEIGGLFAVIAMSVVVYILQNRIRSSKEVPKTAAGSRM